MYEVKIAVFKAFFTLKKKQDTGVEPAYPAWEAGALPID